MLQDKFKIKIRQQGAIATPPPTTLYHQIWSIVKKNKRDNQNILPGCSKKIRTIVTKFNDKVLNEREEKRKKSKCSELGTSRT